MDLFLTQTKTGASKAKNEGKVTIPKFFLWRKKGKRARVEQSETDHAQAVSPVTQEPIEEQAPAAVNDISKDVIPEEASTDAEVAGAALIAATDPQEPTQAPAQESVPVQESEPSEADDIPPAIPRRQSAPTHVQPDEASTDTPIHYFTRPISSPRADSKLKSWFRDRLVRRSSGPIAVYPHQPGPDATDSEPSFTGGAALTGSEEPRSMALSSHPLHGADIPTHNRSSSYYSNDFDVTKTRSGESGANSTKGKKRDRFRKSFLGRISRGDDEPASPVDANGSRRASEVPSSKGTADVPSLRNSALEQGLPPPPTLGETLSTRRESKFSEDL